MIRKEEVAQEASDAVELLRLVEYLLDVADSRPDGEISLPLSGMKVALRQSRELMTRVNQELSDYVQDDMPQPRPRATLSPGSIADRVQPVPGVAAPRARELMGKANSTGGVRQ